MRVAEENGLNVVTGEFIRPSDEQEVEKLDSDKKQEKITQHTQWLGIIKKIFKTLNQMEKNKSSEPKFSLAVFGLMKYVKKTYNFQNGSRRDNDSVDRWTSFDNGNLSFNDQMSLGSMKEKSKFFSLEE